MDPLRQHQRGVSVAQVVESQSWQTTSFYHALKRLSYQVGVQRRPVGMAKNKIAIP